MSKTDDAMTQLVDAETTEAALDYLATLPTKRLHKLADLLYIEDERYMKRSKLIAMILSYARN